MKERQDHSFIKISLKMAVRERERVRKMNCFD